jgi:hypothetical protein
MMSQLLHRKFSPTGTVGMVRELELLSAAGDPRQHATHIVPCSRVLDHFASRIVLVAAWSQSLCHAFADAMELGSQCCCG